MTAQFKGRLPAFAGKLHNLSRPKLTLALTAAGLTCGVIAAVTLTASIGNSRTAAAHKASAEAYKRDLQSQVDSSNGTPQTGRDPSTQQQTSLDQAASTASGNGLRTSTPAAGLTDHSHHHATYADMYGDPSKTGINAAGCFIDYGIPGEQCLAAGLAEPDGALRCDKVRTKFPDGIKVSGTDRFHIDADGDGMACGAGE